MITKVNPPLVKGLNYMRIHLHYLRKGPETLVSEGVSLNSLT